MQNVELLKVTRIKTVKIKTNALLFLPKPAFFRYKEDTAKMVLSARTAGNTPANGKSQKPVFSMTFSHTALTDTAKQVRRSQMQYRIVDTAASVRKEPFSFPSKPACSGRRNRRPAGWGGSARLGRRLPNDRKGSTGKIGPKISSCVIGASEAGIVHQSRRQPQMLRVYLTTEADLTPFQNSQQSDDSEHC